MVIEVIPGPRMPVDDPPAPEDEPADTDASSEAAAGDETGEADASEDPAAEDSTGDTDGVAPPPADGQSAPGAAADEEPPSLSAEPWRNEVPAPGPEPTTSPPAVQRFALGNGLQVWLVESHRLPLVTGSLVSRLGSASDPPGLPGLVDLMTASLDGGTTSRDALGLSRELEAAGATLSEDTGQDGTWLTATSLTGRSAATLAILADVALNPTFPAEEVERVRDAAVVDLRQTKDDAETIAETVALREVYGPGHPYAHGSAGTEEGLRAATIDDLRRAHARAFTPETTALVLSGDVTEAQARTLAEGALGSWDDTPDDGPDGTPATGDTPDGAVGGGSATPPPPGPPAGSPERVILVDRPGASQTALVLAAPGLARSDPDYEPVLVTNQVFGGGFSSRLNLNLRENRGYTYGAYSGVDALRGVGLISIDMAVATPVTGDAVRETLRELETLTATGVTDDELRRAKQYLGGSARTLFDSNRSTLSTLRTLYLDDLPVDYYRTRPARLAGIGTDDATAIARRYFEPAAFTVVAVGDRAAIEPPLRALDLGAVGLRSP